MKAKHFRVGNFVKSNGVISSITSKDLQWMEQGELVTEDFTPNAYNPIPISEDWLRLYNFKYYMKNISGHPEKENMVRRWQYKFFIDGNEWWFDFEVDQQPPTNFFWLNWNFGGSNHFVHLPRKIEYVHQLQNLFFALTGEELELKTVSSTLAANGYNKHR